MGELREGRGCEGRVGVLVVGVAGSWGGRVFLAILGFRTQQ